MDNTGFFDKMCLGFRSCYIQWGKHGFQHVLWHSEAEDDALSSETVFQHNNHPKHTAKITAALLLKVKVMEWPNMSPDLNPIEHMWGILKRKVEKHHVSNIQQLCDVIMEEWKRMLATTSAALVNFMPRRICRWFPYKILTLWTQFWHVHVGCTHFCCQLFGQ